jgi:hypothetical protein
MTHIHGINLVQKDQKKNLTILVTSIVGVCCFWRLDCSDLSEYPCLKIWAELVVICYFSNLSTLEKSFILCSKVVPEDIVLRMDCARNVGGLNFGFF